MKIELKAFNHNALQNFNSMTCFTAKGEMFMPESEIAEKDSRLQVSVEYIDWLEAERRKINSVDLANIDFYQNGEKLDIPEKVINRFKFIGLTNFCFITTGFYAEEHDDKFWKGLVD